LQEKLYTAKHEVRVNPVSHKNLVHLKVRIEGRPL